MSVIITKKINSILKKTTNVVRVSPDEYTITTLDNRGINNTVTIKKFLSGFTPQWSMYVNGVVLILNENFTEFYEDLFNVCSNMSFDFREDEKDYANSQARNVWDNL